MAKTCKWQRLVNDKKENIFVFKKACKTRHYLDVYKQDYSSDSKKEWIVDLDTPSLGRTLKITPSKRDALRFAKSYMRRH